MGKLSTSQTISMIVYLLIAFLFGIVFSEYKAINRANELLQSDQVSYDSYDLTYVAIGRKQTKQ